MLLLSTSLVALRQRPLAVAMLGWTGARGPVARCSAAAAAPAPAATVAGSPQDEYQRLVAAGELRADVRQERVMELFHGLYTELAGFTPPEPQAASGPGLFGGVLSALGVAKKQAPPETLGQPKGIYLHGGVGAGKTMMMDMLFERVDTDRKRRVHFNTFMLDVHARIHDWRQQREAAGIKAEDPIPELSRQLITESWFLCFDEFQVTDVADAMILRRLFRSLWSQGCVMVATSNRQPDDLYKNGLQRESFVPFIELMKRVNTVHDIDSARDYRLSGTLSKSLYRHPLGGETTQALESMFKELTGRSASGANSKVLSVMAGRRLTVQVCAKGTAMFHFDELCSEALGAADYTAICKNFHTVILDGIPQLKMAQRNEARRFITLVDELYQHKVKLICGADGPPETIFVQEIEEVQLSGQELETISELEGGKGTKTHRMASVFSGEDEVFAFQRCLSRLTEMQTREYLEIQARPGDL